MSWRFCSKVAGVKSLLDTLTKGFNRLHHPSQLIMVPHLGFQLPLLFGDDGQALFQFELAPLVLFE